MILCMIAKEGLCVSESDKIVLIVLIMYNNHVNIMVIIVIYEVSKYLWHPGDTHHAPQI